MDKNSNNLRSLRVGDKITLYGIANGGKTAIKKEFEVYIAPTYISNNSFRIVCYVVGRNGRTRGWCGRENLFDLIWSDQCSNFAVSYGNSIVHFYTDPKIPCEMAIKNLKEQKRQINKKIMDYQRFMYQIEKV